MVPVRLALVNRLNCHFPLRAHPSFQVFLNEHHPMPIPHPWNVEALI